MQNKPMLINAMGVAVLAAGVVLRASGLTASSLWYDEAYSLAMTRLDLIPMVKTAMIDFNPPLWELVQWPVVRLLGSTELASRLPSLLASILSLWLVVLLCRQYQLTPGQSLAACAMAALLPYQWWMAQDGRVYAIMTALYLGGILFALRGRWLGLGAVCGLLLYCHLTAGALVISLLLLAWINHRQAWRKIALVGAGAALSFAPWLPSYLHAGGMSFWSGTLAPQVFVGAWTLALWGSTLPSLGEVFCVVVFCFVSICQLMTWVFTTDGIVNRETRTNTASMAIAAMLPILGMLAVSLLYKNVLIYRTIAPLAIPMMIWQSAMITPRRLTRTTWIIPAIWASLFVISIITWSPVDRGGMIREVAGQINLQERPGDIVYHATGTSYLPFGLYLDPDLPQYLLDEEQDPGLLQTGLANIFGIHRSGPEVAGTGRTWIIWARDPSMTERATGRMAQLVSNARLVAVITAWQFSPIDIYLKEQ